MTERRAVGSKKRILLVDDHPLMRQGIGQLIDGEPDLMVCGEAEDRVGALAAVAATKPDLVVVDISLRGDSGLDLIKDLRVRWPGLLSLVLSMHDESLYAERALRAGARGYIMKREASEKVLDAIRRVLEGAVFVSGNVAAGILDRISGHPVSGAKTGLEALSDREMEVMLLIGKGHGSQQIARQLHLSVKTIETHRANIKAKLNLATSNELLQRAIRWAQQMGEL